MALGVQLKAYLNNYKEKKMGNYDFLKEYVVDGQQSCEIKRHVFYGIDKNEITQAENRMGRKFPDDLKKFYFEIGYGFLCKDDKTHTNRIMHPRDIADFYSGDELYSYVDRDLYESNEMVFFALNGQGDFLTLRLDELKDYGAVYYFDRKISDSLKDFLMKMNQKTNYYMNE